MHILLHPDRQPTLEDPDDLTRFSVVSPIPAGSDAIVKMLVPAGVLDNDAPSSHAWIDADWLVAMGPSTASWQARFQRMLQHAAANGWTDGSGHIRAHFSTC